MIKTVSLTADTETKVEISGGYNVGVINRTTDMLYASKKSGISAGADDVAAIPAGDSYVIRAADDTVYLLATAAGDVQLESIGVTEVFKVAAARSSSGGGGTVDDVARQAIASHANNDEIHLTAEKAIEAAATAISNDNLLINPDLSINQRGQTEYTQRNAYTVDGWKLHASVGNVFNPETKTLTIPQNDTSAWYGIVQPVEHDLAGKTVTMSAEVETDVDIYLRIIYGNITSADFTQLVPAGFSGVATLTCTIPETAVGGYAVQITNRNKVTAGGSIKVEWAKLEYGSVATPYIPPNPATELTKCQRYYQVRTSGDIDPTDLRPSMAEITDIVQREDGNYAYIAAI